MTAKICVSIKPKTMSEALFLIEKAEAAHADFIEVRLDCLETSRRLSDLTSHTKIRLIATNKLVSEKGFFSGTDAQRQETLFKAAQNGFEYVDVDISSLTMKQTIQELKRLGAKPILSFHNFDGPLTSSEMQNALETEIINGASVCKIITTAKKLEDNLTMLNFLVANKDRANMVCFCMGEHGKISRLLSPLFGAFFTFASLEEGSETASGQINIKDMKTAYALLEQKQ